MVQPHSVSILNIGSCLDRTKNNCKKFSAETLLFYELSHIHVVGKMSNRWPCLNVM